MKSILSSTLKLIGSFVAVAAAATIVWQTAVYFNEAENKTDAIENKLETIIHTQKIQQGQQEIQQRQTDSILVNINKLNRNVKELTLSSDNLKNYMMRHSNSREEMLEVLDIWESKKNSQNAVGSIAYK